MNQDKLEKAQAFVNKYEAKLEILDDLKCNDPKDGVLFKIKKKYKIPMSVITECIALQKQFTDPSKVWPTKNEKIQYRIYKERINKHDKLDFDSFKVIADDFYLSVSALKNIIATLDKPSIKENKNNTNKVISEIKELEAISRFVEKKPPFVWTNADVNDFLGKTISNKTISNYIERWGVKPIKAINKKTNLLDKLNGTKLTSYSDVEKNARSNGYEIILLDHFGISICQEELKNKRLSKILHQVSKYCFSERGVVNKNVLSIQGVFSKKTCYMATDIIDDSVI